MCKDVYCLLLLNKIFNLRKDMKKILIGEDQKELSHALKLKLASENFDVTLAENGEDFLAAFDKNTYDLIILDIIMPKMDGFDVLKKLKERDNKIKIIVVSNLSQPEDKKKAIQLGADEYFVKSDTSLGQIVERIKSFF
jgi:DNA-binding response OmpR family regulator